MLKASEFKGFLTEKEDVFKVLANDGCDWVIKAKKHQDRNSKQLFNEYFAGLLAHDFGLSKPRVEIIDIVQVKEKLNDNFDKSANEAIAIQYINDLETYVIGSPTENKQRIQAFFGYNYDFSDFYAYQLFSAWIFLKERAELYTTNDNIPIFLDFDYAFGGTEWSGERDWNNGVPAEYWLEQLPFASFCDGIIEDWTLFDPWIARLSNLDKIKYGNLMDDIPNSWKPLSDYVKIKSAWLDLLFDNMSDFINAFRSFITNAMENHLSFYLPQLITMYSQIESIWLIGSRANDTHKEDSDWDFLIFADEELLNSLEKRPALRLQYVDFLVVFNGDDFRDPWSNKRGSLSDWKWKQLSTGRAKYWEVKWAPSSSNHIPGQNDGRFLERERTAVIYCHQ